jgi:hypothetical protein
MSTTPTAIPACVYHPQVQASDYCPACALPYCSSCLVEFLGRKLCQRCRDAQLAQMHGPPPDRPPTFADQIIPARNPQALTGYYLGVFSLIPCLGALLGPAALTLGILAIRARKRNPNLPGQAHAVVAIVLGGLTTLANWGLLTFSLLSTLIWS